jgi:hypothetical protein
LGVLSTCSSVIHKVVKWDNDLEGIPSSRGSDLEGSGGAAKVSVQVLSGEMGGERRFLIRD